MLSTWEYLLLIILGSMPSLVWLVFYLRKDCHPEPKHLIIKTFLMGIIVSPFAIILQKLFVEVAVLVDPTAVANSSSYFLWAAFIEELVKFYAVKAVVLRDPEFDEPVDAMIYMITAALGFAAMENILVMRQAIPDGIHYTIRLWTLRFVGATLLHALSSALIGYFLAMAWFLDQHRQKLIIIGLAMATLFHFVFNTFLAFVRDQIYSLTFTTILLIIMAFIIASLFDKIKGRHRDTNISLT